MYIIALEGPDGVGKSTVHSMISDHCVKESFPRRYKNAIFDKYLSGSTCMDQSFFAKDRMAFLNELESYHIGDGDSDVVVCDRWIYSGIIHQGRQKEDARDADIVIYIDGKQYLDGKMEIYDKVLSAEEMENRRLTVMNSIGDDTMFVHFDNRIVPIDSMVSFINDLILSH